MVQDIVIVGAGGLGREVLWLLQELNSKNKIWNVKGFVDDNESLQNTYVNDYPVLGSINWLSKCNEKMSVVCCIANPKIREQVLYKLQDNMNLDYPNVVDKAVRISDRVKLGRGNIICIGVTLTVDIHMGDFNIVNPSCTIGHDVIFGNYNTVYPGSNISGNINIRNRIEVGTGTQIIQGKSIWSDVILGAGSVVLHDIVETGTYVGVPVKKIK